MIHFHCPMHSATEYNINDFMITDKVDIMVLRVMLFQLNTALPSKLARSATRATVMHRVPARDRSSHVHDLSWAMMSAMYGSRRARSPALQTGTTQLFCTTRQRGQARLGPLEIAPILLVLDCSPSKECLAAPQRNPLAPSHVYAWQDALIVTQRDW